MHFNAFSSNLKASPENCGLANFVAGTLHDAHPHSCSKHGSSAKHLLHGIRQALVQSLEEPKPQTFHAKLL